MKVEALTEIYEISEFKVENGILHINVERKQEKKNQTLWSKIDDIKLSSTMEVVISMRDIRELRVNGGGKIIGENSIASNMLDLGVSGSGSIVLDIKGQTVKTNISGSGNVTLNGYASKNNISLSGSGKLSAFNFELLKANVNISGSGSCEINVTESLNAELYGSGSVQHKGATKTVNAHVFGPGQVERAY